MIELPVRTEWLQEAQHCNAHVLACAFGMQQCCEIGVDVAVGAIQLVNERKLMEHYDALTRCI
jgi:hypothetical protein